MTVTVPVWVLILVGWTAVGLLVAAVLAYTSDVTIKPEWLRYATLAVLGPGMWALLAYVEGGDWLSARKRARGDRT